MQKLTYKELVDLIAKHNKEHNVTSQFGDKHPLHCVIVFKNDSWPKREKDYPLESRSYEFTSDNKRFVPGLGGNSIFASCLDGSDQLIRLDWYIHEWDIDYCYIKEN